MTWAAAMSYGLRKVWDRAKSARNNVAATKAPAAATVVVDRATALRRELQTVQFIDSTSAMIERRPRLRPIPNGCVRDTPLNLFPPAPSRFIAYYIRVEHFECICSMNRWKI